MQMVNLLQHSTACQLTFQPVNESSPSSMPLFTTCGGGKASNRFLYDWLLAKLSAGTENYFDYLGRQKIQSSRVQSGVRLANRSDLESFFLTSISGVSLIRRKSTPISRGTRRDPEWASALSGSHKHSPPYSTRGSHA